MAQVYPPTSSPPGQRRICLSHDDPAPGRLQICGCSRTVLCGAGSLLLLGVICLSLSLCECSGHLLRISGLQDELLSALPQAWAAEVLRISCKGSHATTSALGLVLVLKSLLCRPSSFIQHVTLTCLISLPFLKLPNLLREVGRAFQRSLYVWSGLKGNQPYQHRRKDGT